MESHTFEDFDAYAHALRDAQVDLTLSHANAGQWKLAHFELGDVGVQMGSDPGGLIGEGVAAADRFILCCITSAAASCNVNGRTLGERTAFLTPPGGHFCVAAAAPHDWFSVSIPAHVLRSRRGRRADDRGVTFVDASPDEWDAVCDLVGALFESERACPGLFGSPAAAAAARAKMLDVVFALLRLDAGRRASLHSGRRRIPREHIIRCTAAHLERHAGEHVTIDELGGAADVSQRTLRKAFHEYYGVSPARYLKLRTLHEVRRALEHPASGLVTVTSVMTGLGVWELGRASGEYLRLFGEHPSATLHRARGVCATH